MRKLEQSGCWTRGTFIKLQKKLNVSPSIDWFQARLNTQIPEFIYIIEQTLIKGNECFHSIMDRSKVLCFSSISMFAQCYSENMER